MRIIEIIIIALIIVYSIFKVIRPDEKDKNKSGFVIFIKTFLFCFVLYLIVSFIISFIFGASIPFLALNRIFGR